MTSFLLLLLCSILVLGTPFSLAARLADVNSLSKYNCNNIGVDQSKLFASTEGTDNNAIIGSNNSPSKPVFRVRNIIKRWITGLSLGAVGTLLIASGDVVFSIVMLITSILMQQEYYNMVEAKDIKPLRNFGIVLSTICGIISLFFSTFHGYYMPCAASFLLIWQLLTGEKAATISELATSIMGIFYVGYMPIFWMKLRSLKAAAEITCSSTLPALFTAQVWQPGACVMWWTWTSIVFSDVGAYFGGKNFGKHKLGTVSKAAGAASPNKTVQGAIAGFLSCMLVSTIGAYIMKWPAYRLTGAVYGLMLGILGLAGDLFASMLKRDAGLKDTGNILPGHGGLLDRFDSYIFSAPAAYFFVTIVLPLVTRRLA